MQAMFESMGVKAFAALVDWIGWMERTFGADPSGLVKPVSRFIWRMWHESGGDSYWTELLQMLGQMFLRCIG